MTTNLKNHGTSSHEQFAQHSDQNGLTCRALCGVDGCDRPIFVKKSGLCHRHYDQEFYKRHAEQLRAYSRMYHAANPEKTAATKKAWSKKNPEKVLARRLRWDRNNAERKKFLRERWEQNNPGRHSESTKKWRTENRDQMLATRRRYLAEKKLTDPEFKILCILRNRICRAMKSQAGKKAYKTIDLLGCTVAEFRLHLMLRWKPGMSWENYGRGKEKWNIDHIIPCDSFDLRKPIHQKTCFHYSNQRPLWQPENCAKSNLVGNAQIPLI